MRAMSSLGTGLAVVSSLLLLALVAELCYIFWWKKRCNSKLSMLFCLKTPTPIPMMPRSCSHSRFGGGGGGGSDSASVAVTVRSQVHHDRDEPLRGGAGAAAAEEAIDAELMRLHSLAGPPRFLFTIKEETREELLLESDDGRSKRGPRGKSMSLGDLLHCAESPFLTPLSSPPLPFLQRKSNSTRVNFDSLKKLGFNPLFEWTRLGLGLRRRNSSS